MTTCLGKSCSFGLQCLSFVYVYLSRAAGKMEYLVIIRDNFY